MKILTAVLAVFLMLAGCALVAQFRSANSGRFDDLKARATSVPLPRGFDVDRLLNFHRTVFGPAAMILWTDITEPAYLTGYARAAMEDYEQKRGTLARWLPYRDIVGIVARFVKGQTGLLEISKFRAYDAAPEVGKRPTGARVALELPALGETVPVSEYEQLRSQGVEVADQAILTLVESTTTQQVQKAADLLEYMRGVVLSTGIATIAQDNFASADDFGRSGSHSVVAGTLWSVSATADPLADLTSWSDTYIDDTGEPPGAILASTAAIRALAKTKPFALQLVNGGARQASIADVNAILDGENLPPIIAYDRRVKRNGTTSRVWPANKIALLPAPVATDDWEGTELGATFMGTSLSSTDTDWGIDRADQPGLVAGLWREDKPPRTAEVITDGVGLPVLANADLSFVAQVLA